MEQYQIDNMLSNLQSYLETNGIRTDRFFQCINPEHPDRHPSMKYYDDNHVHCFGCGCTYDLIDVISIFENLDKKDAFKKAIEYCGNENIEISKSYYTENASKETSVKNYEKAYKIWHRNLMLNKEAQKYLFIRGLDNQIIARFNLGFNCFDFKDKKLNAVIVPINENCFSARNINPNEDFRYYKPKNCHVDLFNKQALTNQVTYCVLAEGEFDCLSFESIGVNCVGFGSACNINKFFETEKNKNKTYIIALDNDEAGFIGKEKLKEYFKENKIKFAEFDNCECKDPNEALIKNKNAFKESIFSLIKKIEKQNYAEL